MTHVLQNVFEFSDESCLEMRVKIKERVALLNNKSEFEARRVKEDCQKYSDMKQRDIIAIAT